MFKQVLGAHKGQGYQSYMRKPFDLSARNHTLILSKTALKPMGHLQPNSTFCLQEVLCCLFSMRLKLFSNLHR